MEITFSEEIRTKMLTLDPKDLIMFIESITRSTELKGYARAYITSLEEQPEDRSSKMTNIIFKFQTWKKKESGFGTKWTWRNYRALGFSCSNMNLFKISEPQNS